MSLIETLKAEYADLILPRFAEAEALELGQILLLKAAGLPVVINIRTPGRTLFHAALPGSAPMNDAWARRKSNCALFFHKPSLLVGEENSIKDQDFSAHGLNAADYADHGGAVPIRVAGCGVVAVATISGLASREDHRLVISGLQTLLASGI
ncbi:MAG: heme-degrading domain-containing protein [Cypionkella sp.]